MDNIIAFPSSPAEKQRVKQVISAVCRRAGLTALQSQQVIDEYLEYHQQLSLTAQQQVTPIDSDAMQQLSQQHQTQLNHACHIIISLLIQKHLS